MLEFRKIEEKEFDEFYEVLEEAFPFVERKTKQNAYLDFKNMNNFMPCFIVLNGEKVGIISYWIFDDFVFAEHLAIKKDLRNKKLGAEFFPNFLKSFNLPVLFEVEKPYDDLSLRRVNFYKRLGVIFNDFLYFQPSYHREDDKVPMIIASFPKALSLNQFDKFISVVKKCVYKI